MRIVLGSSSKWRKQIMEELGFVFDVMNPNINERAIDHPDPFVLPRLIAKAKAMALLPKIIDEVILITADQVVRCGLKIRGKPENSLEAMNFLKSYHQDFPRTFSAVYVVNTKNKRFSMGVEAVTIAFEAIPEEIIDTLSRDADILNSAGAFTQNPLLLPYMKILNGTVDSVMGLPKELTKFLIEQVA